MIEENQNVNMPLISVIVPAYNVERWIRACCESVFAQTYTNWELIVVDDGSQDETPAILDELSACRDKMIVIHTSNGGVSRARNIGIERANGEYITFIDSDDYVDPQFLEEAYKLIDRYKSDVYICGLCEEWIDNETIIDIKQYTASKTTIYDAKSLLEGYDVAYSGLYLAVPVCKLFQKDILMRHAIRFDTSMNRLEDTRFVYDVICKAESYVVDESVFYHYRNWSKNTLSKFPTTELPRCANECVKSINAAIKIRKPNYETVMRFKRITMGMILSSIYPYYNMNTSISLISRLGTIKELANNEVVQTYALTEGLSWRQCVLVIALRMKLYFLVDFMYSWVYRRKID